MNTTFKTLFAAAFATAALSGVAFAGDASQSASDDALLAGVNQAVNQDLQKMTDKIVATAETRVADSAAERHNDTADPAILPADDFVLASNDADQ